VRPPDPRDKGIVKRFGAYGRKQMSFSMVEVASTPSSGQRRGKTTFFNALSGCTSRGGTISFEGKRIDGLAPRRYDPPHGAHLPEHQALRRHDSRREHMVGAYTRLSRALSRPCSD